MKPSQQTALRFLEIKEHIDLMLKDLEVERSKIIASYPKGRTWRHRKVSVLVKRVSKAYIEAHWRVGSIQVTVKRNESQTRKVKVARPNKCRR